jgi:hypothetical protein
VDEVDVVDRVDVVDGVEAVNDVIFDPATIDMLAAMRSRPNAVFWIKLAAQAAFGSLLIVDSFFLITCYITVDFFGTLANPLFGWLRTCAFVGWILYFPALLGALLSIDIGQNSKRSQRLAASFVVVQMIAGFALYFSDGRKASAGPALLYGPNVRMPIGDITTCIEAFVCLVPLMWISFIHIATAFRSGTKGTPASKTNLAPFLMAGAGTFLLYAVSSGLKSTSGRQPIPILALAVSLMAHLAVFAVIFLVLQWITLLAGRFSNPAAAQFIMRAVAAALLLAFVVRKIIFSLLAFNTYVASLYAIVFSFAVVLFVAALALKIKEHYLLAGNHEKPDFLSLRSGPSRAGAVIGIIGLFYLLTIKLAAIDWERIISSVSALVICLLLLWLCRQFWSRPKSYRPFFLLVVSILAVGALTGVRLLGQGADLNESVARHLEQYADYDPSFFVIQLALKPAVQDEAYAGFYAFLNKHANIRAKVPVPEITLTDSLKAERVSKPNVFFLVIDALRRDYLSPYNPAVTFTPRIEAFARDSVVFQNAYTPYAGTALAEPAIWAGFQQLHKLYPPPHAKVSNLQRMLDVDGFHCYISYDEVLYDIVPQSSNVTVLSSRLTRWQQKEFGMVIDELEGDLLQRKDRDRPIFLYTQPADVHTLSLALHGQQVAVTPHPGFNDKYASAVEQVDQTFGGFIEFLKKQNLYENSIVIVTADHGESLGEMGRLGHVSNVTPEVARIPLLIHLPERLRTGMFWDTTRQVSLHDLAPTLFYLLGHRPLKRNEMLGRPLFTLSQEEQAGPQPDHFLLMSSYMPVFGVLSQDQRELFVVDASLRRQYYYNLADDPFAFKNRITVPIRDHYEPILRNDLEKIDKFYGIAEKELGR